MAAGCSTKLRSITVPPLVLSCRLAHEQNIKDPGQCARSIQAMSSETKILLIEDDAGIRDTLQRVLTEEGHEVAVADRGDTGLHRASKDVFNLIITDLRLPGVGGLDLVRQLHAAQPRLPIILITAFGTTETAIEATKLGAYDYVLKPFDMAELLDLVAKSVACKRLMSEPVEMGAARSNRSAIIGNGRA